MDTKQKKIIYIIFVLIIVISVLFVIYRYVPFGERSRFVGTWYQPDEGSLWAMTFNSDGTCSDLGWPGTWEIKGGELIVKTLNGQATSRWTYSFSDEDRSLDLSGRGEWRKWG
jgi:hypothetical protein